MISDRIPGRSLQSGRALRNLQPPSLDRAKEHYVKATELGAAPDASLERLIQ